MEGNFEQIEAGDVADNDDDVDGCNCGAGGDGGEYESHVSSV